MRRMSRTINRNLNQGKVAGAPGRPVVQLVTSKPSDVGTWVRIPVQSHELEFFLKNKYIRSIISKNNKIIKCSVSGDRLVR